MLKFICFESVVRIKLIFVFFVSKECRLHSSKIGKR